MLAKTVPTMLSSLKSTVKDTASISKAKVKALYFSANGIPQSKRFTPILAKTYNEVNKSSKDFEVIFVSLDKSKHKFERYYKDMPWPAVPFEDKETVKKLAAKYNVQSIPNLVLVDDDGNVIKKEGYLELAQSSNPAEVIESWKSKY